MKKILIIEDNIILLESIYEFLTQEGYEVYKAMDGTMGIEKAMEFLPDLIISDINMPKKDGYEVCRMLQSIPETALIPFIFLTSKTQNEDLRRGMQLGADDFLTKPFEFEELLKTVRLRINKHDRYINQSDEKFYKLIDNPLIGVYIYQNNKFVYTNSKLIEILGYPKNELNTMSFEDLGDNNSENEDAFTKISRCIKGIQSSIHVKLNIIKNNKTRSTVEIYGTMVLLKGKESLMGNIIEVKKGKYIEILPGNNTDKSKLSQREIEVLKLICKGFSSSEISQKLSLSQRTIESHRTNLIVKTESRNTPDMVMFAIRNGIIDL